jgi:hypothetical protein
MLPDDETREPESAACDNLTQNNSAPMAGAGVEPELQALSSDALDGYSWNQRGGHAATKEFAGKEFFAGQKWHRSYAEALIEIDPGKRVALISESRHAILDRYLELGPVPSPTDEFSDLRKAVVALSEIETKCLAASK